MQPLKSFYQLCRNLIPMKRAAFFLLSAMAFTACEPEPDEVVIEPVAPRLIMKFKFDPEQERLNNLGLPASMPVGNAAQSPNFKKMAAHYVELAPTALTMLGDGLILYKAPETDTGGSMAIDFSKSKPVAQNAPFLSIPISTLQTGIFEYLRVSLSYQEYDIDYRAQGFDLTGRLASFLGFNQYITTYNLDGANVVVNANKLQGYWAFRTLGQTIQGQVPPGGITVPNPIFDTSPVPQGSCVVTGKFDYPLYITGTETEDIVITVSLSINNSFEWTEVVSDGKYEPSIGETVVDMGIRGMLPIIE